MRATTLLRNLLDQKYTRVVGFGWELLSVVIDVAPTTRVPCCSGCGRAVHSVWDRRERRWRHLDFAGMQVHLRYQLRRVDCERCGVTSELVPWAEPTSRFTRDFEDTAAGFFAASPTLQFGMQPTASVCATMPHVGPRFRLVPR